MGKVFKWHDSIAMRADQAKKHAFISQAEALQAVKDREELIRDYQNLKTRYEDIARIIINTPYWKDPSRPKINAIIDGD